MSTQQLEPGRAYAYSEVKHLLKNGHNRQLDEKNVIDILDKAKEWGCIASPIVCDVSGTIMFGHHRKAAADMKPEVQTWVFVNPTLRASRKVSAEEGVLGRRHQLADHLYIHRGVRSYDILSDAARVLDVRVNTAYRLLAGKEVTKEVSKQLAAGTVQLPDTAEKILTKLEGRFISFNRKLGDRKWQRICKNVRVAPVLAALMLHPEYRERKLVETMKNVIGAGLGSGGSELDKARIIVGAYNASLGLNITLEELNLAELVRSAA